MGAGLRLKEILRERKMTIKQLSETANVSLNTLYSITKRDSEKIDPVILSQIASALGVSEDTICPSSVLNDEDTSLHAQISSRFPNLDTQSINNLIYFFSKMSESEIDQFCKCLQELASSYRKNPDSDVIDIASEDGTITAKLTIMRNVPPQE